MHGFICFLATAVLCGIAAGATTRPLGQIGRTATVERGYQEQDTARAFYSYGYSDANAARAEYKSLDGSSRGFYSYVDANGQLQTVNYEAGGRQGFKAEASNLPKAPVDDRKPPLPVTDTLEVQQARQAHLNALREAQEQARTTEQEQQQEQKEEQDRAQQEQPLSDEDAAILERVRAELTSMLAERQRAEGNRPADEDNDKEDDDSQAVEQAAQAAQTERRLLAAREQARQLEREQAQPLASGLGREQRPQVRNDADDLRLRTIYSLADISSSSYLKLSDLEDRQELRVPVGAYYSYSSPDAKYSVTTPTELRTLRPVAISRSVLLTKRN